MTLSFPMQAISYRELRADGPYEWNVAYDLGADAAALKVELRIDLVGDDPGPLVERYERRAEAIWNHKVFLSDGERLHAFEFDVDFVETDAHQTVTFHDVPGRANMTNRYASSITWGASYVDEIAAHDVR